jgi:Family of unknown function (DUF6130)
VTAPDRVAGESSDIALESHHRAIDRASAILFDEVASAVSRRHAADASVPIWIKGDNGMTVIIKTLLAVIAGILMTASAFAQSARDIRGPTPLIAIPNEPPAKLIVDPPIAEQLALGRVMIQYRAENLRILPVFGSGALSVSPRVGHLHCFVDDIPFPIVDSSGETVVLVGLTPGPHKVRLVLAEPTHKAIAGTEQTVTFTVPAPASH